MDCGGMNDLLKVHLESKTNLGDDELFRFGLGMSRISNGGEVNANTVEGRLRTLRDLTENFKVLVDTSPIYGNGLSEEILKQPLSEKRDQIYLATKYYPQDHHKNLDLIQSIDLSLGRMGVEHIDLLQIHFPNPLCRFESIAEGLQSLILAGKIKNVGLSNYTPRESQDLIELYPNIEFLTNQIEVYLTNIEILNSFNKSSFSKILTYGSLLQGRLAATEKQRILLKKIGHEFNLSAAAVTILMLLEINSEVLPILRISQHKNLEEFMKIFAIKFEESVYLRFANSFQEDIKYVEHSRIKLIGDNYRAPYLKLEEALINMQELFPSPAAFAARILKFDIEFPLKVRDLGNGTYEIDTADPFDQIKKYWAYRIAKPHENIPVTIVEP